VGLAPWAWLEPDQPAKNEVTNKPKQAASIPSVPYQLRSPAIRKGTGYPDTNDFVVSIMGRLPIVWSFCSM